MKAYKGKIWSGDSYEDNREKIWQSDNKIMYKNILHELLKKSSIQKGIIDRGHSGKIEFEI